MSVKNIHLTPAYLQHRTQGFKNIAADALSTLDIVDTPNPVKNNFKSINEHYGLEDEDISQPTNYKAMMRNHQKDKDLIKIARKQRLFYTEFSCS